MNSSTGTSAGGGGGKGRSWPSTTSVSASGKRVQNDMFDLNLNPPSYCFAGPKGDSLYHWVATLIGTPYEDGIFFLDITFPSEYPFKPPEKHKNTQSFLLLRRTHPHRRPNTGGDPVSTPLQGPTTVKLELHFHIDGT
ncbi:hypothetical protein CsSME_00047619 [Camellia sinensis var. sinensis]